MVRRTLPPFPSEGDWRDWANRLYEYLSDPGARDEEILPKPLLLQHQTKAVLSRASVDGLVMFDPTLQQIVYSSEGAWIPINPEAPIPPPTPVYRDSFYDPTGEASWSIVGDRLECWGSYAGPDANPKTITLPKTFAFDPTITTQVRSTFKHYSTVRSRSTTDFEVNRYNNSGDDVETNFMWYAIGEWDGVS